MDSSFAKHLPLILSCVSAVATACAAWAAYKSARATELIVESQTSPIVNVYIESRDDEPAMAIWTIENSGFGNAKNVKFEFEGKPYGILDPEKKHEFLPARHPFSCGIPTLPSKKKFCYNIDLWSKLENKKFTVKWSYQNEQGKIFNSEFVYDDLKSSWMAVNTPPLTRIAKSLEECVSALKPAQRQ